MLGLFGNHLSPNCVEIFHQYLNHQEYDLLTFFVFLLGDLFNFMLCLDVGGRRRVKWSEGEQFNYFIWIFFLRNEREGFEGV